MKRSTLVVLFALVTLSLSTPLRSQMSMDYFKKPDIANIFQPVVGSGGVYQSDRDNKKETFEMSVVGKDTIEGKEAYWLEFGRSDEKSGGMTYGKMLVTKEDFRFHRMVVQPAGQPQPMEITLNPDAIRRDKTNEALDKWHKVGTESITVPAGTFACDHWAASDGKGDIWVSAKISPYGLVKEVDAGRTTLLIKVISDAKDHIIGTPMKFDPEAMKRQMMERMQKPQKP